MLNYLPSHWPSPFSKSPTSSLSAPSTAVVALPPRLQVPVCRRWNEVAKPTPSTFINFRKERTKNRFRLLLYQLPGPWSIILYRLINWCSVSGSHSHAAEWDTGLWARRVTEFLETEVPRSFGASTTAAQRLGVTAQNTCSSVGLG